MINVFPILNRLPPGPWGLPFLGIAYKLKAEKLLELLGKWKDRYGDIFSFCLAGQYVVVVNNEELITDVLIKRLVLI